LDLSERCKVRRLGATQFETPLLVPSYSSRGFYVYAVLEDTSIFCQDAKLLSAYDIYHGLITRKQVFSADLVFIDSGHYEKLVTHNPGEPYEDTRPGSKPWNTEMYDKTLASLKGGPSQLVRVTYDSHSPVRNQARLARASATRHPDMLLDFLLKTERETTKRHPPKPTHEHRAITKMGRLVEFADIIGFTEKELGSSYRDRAETLSKIRTTLYENGIDKPIHVFGCLDPFGVFVYMAAGADIFDGLSWLRLAWIGGQLTYIPTSVATRGRWQDKLEAAVRSTQIDNLSALRELGAAARAFARGHGFRDVKPPWKQYEAPVTNVLDDLGIHLER
jgi:hypothetical protein